MRGGDHPNVGENNILFEDNRKELSILSIGLFLPISAKVSTTANLKTLYYYQEEVCFPHLAEGKMRTNVVSCQGML